MAIDNAHTITSGATAKSLPAVPISHGKHTCNQLPVCPSNPDPRTEVE